MGIRDAESGKRWELQNLNTLGNMTMDYALISRLVHPQRKPMTVDLEDSPIWGPSRLAGHNVAARNRSGDGDGATGLVVKTTIWVRNAGGVPCPGSAG